MLLGVRLEFEFEFESSHKMKTIRVLVVCLVCWGSAAWQALGFSWSYTLSLGPGFNLISTPALESPETMLDQILTGVPDGSTIWEFGAPVRGSRPTSTYSSVGGGWDIDYLLPPGQGAFLWIPSTADPFTLTISGVARETRAPSSYAGEGGIYLLSDTIPSTGSSFADVVGRGPLAGEAVYFWDYGQQRYAPTVYDGDTGTWNHGAPVLGMGEAAIFDLQNGPVPVPEWGGGYCLLAGLLLAGLAASGCLGMRRKAVLIRRANNYSGRDETGC
jgi:hypothetical protein